MAPIYPAFLGTFHTLRRPSYRKRYRVPRRSSGTDTPGSRGTAWDRGNNEPPTGKRKFHLAEGARGSGHCPYAAADPLGNLSVGVASDHQPPDPSVSVIPGADPRFQALAPVLPVNVRSVHFANPYSTNGGFLRGPQCSFHRDRPARTRSTVNNLSFISRGWPMSWRAR